jgi:ABC-type sugar transport system permease subunit
MTMTTAPPGNDARRGRRHRWSMSDSAVGWAMVAPTLIVLAAVFAYPLVSTALTSLSQVKLQNLDRSRFVGLDNYLDFVASPAFWQAVGRTAYFTVVSVGVELILGIVIAAFIGRRFAGWRLLRIAIIIPWAVPTIAVATMFRWIYNADYGALNGLLFQLGAIDKYVPWLSDPFAAMNWVIVADVWHSTPFVVLIMLAAMAGIPGELYEAARMDGASRWQSFWNITLPTLKGAVLVVLVVRTVEAFRVFDIIYVLTGGGPANGTLVISYVAYQETFRFFNLGRGAALSFLISLFVIAVALVYLRLLSERKGEAN